MRASQGSIHRAPWPTWDAAATEVSEIEMAVQIDSRVRDHITVAAAASEEMVRAAAMAVPAVQVLLLAREVRRVIVVPGRLVNIVTG